MWRQLKDGYVIDARASVELLNQELDLQIPENAEYETIAGYVLEHLKHIPRVGEFVELPDGRRLTVRRASPRAIKELYLEHQEPVADAQE